MDEIVFQVGQMIRFYHDYAPFTAVGIVRSVCRSSLGVEVLSTSKPNWRYGHDCNGSVPDKNGWWITQPQVIEILCANGDARLQISEESLMGF